MKKQRTANNNDTIHTQSAMGHMRYTHKRHEDGLVFVFSSVSADWTEKENKQTKSETQKSLLILV